MYSSAVVSSCPIPSRVAPSQNWSPSPDSLGQTPGGTLFSTTPGGTRIIYDRTFLLHCRNSPLARTPPPCLPQIRGVTIPKQHPKRKAEKLDENGKDLPADDDQFVMDI